MAITVDPLAKTTPDPSVVYSSAQLTKSINTMLGREVIALGTEHSELMAIAIVGSPLNRRSIANGLAAGIAGVTNHPAIRLAVAQLVVGQSELFADDEFEVLILLANEFLKRFRGIVDWSLAKTEGLTNLLKRRGQDTGDTHILAAYAVLRNVSFYGKALVDDALSVLKHSTDPLPGTS